jgi:hypothetical protein
LEIPARHVLEQIVSKTNLPAWMLGMYWSTTERMATLEVESCLQDAKIRQLAMTPEFIRLFSTVLSVRGKTWKTITIDPDKAGDWGFYFETPNLRDVMAMANARFLNAQADMMERGGQATPTATSVQVGQATFALPATKEADKGTRGQGDKGTCVCGKTHLQPSTSSLHHHDGKELNRPKAWPELDKVETEFEAELKYDWSDLKTKVFGILGLKSDPSDKSHSSKAFSFDDSQRKQILAALRDYLGWYEPTADDSTIAWYYGQAYSLGLIQAANLMGKERPLLDILKNQEIFDRLALDGFQLVQNSATDAIRNDILGAMEQGMQDGANPRSVAETLNQLFDDQNSDWERLARTEMSMSAERAKVDEWGARGVDTEGAVIAGQDTHPRCRCANTIQDDGNGNLRMVFSPAPDACALCFSMQEGSKRVTRRQGGKRADPPPAPSYEKMTAALEKIADRPINIRVEPGKTDINLTLTKGGEKRSMKLKDSQGNVKAEVEVS